jgi:hypothetical protein
MRASPPATTAPHLDLIERIGGLGFAVLMLIGLTEIIQSGSPTFPGVLEIEAALQPLSKEEALQQARLAATIDFGNAASVQTYVSQASSGSRADQIDAAQRWVRVDGANAQAQLTLGTLLLTTALAEGRRTGTMDVAVLLQAERALMRATQISPDLAEADVNLKAVQKILGQAP